MAVIYDGSTIMFLAWIGLFMPVLAWLSYRKVKSGQPLAPKVRRFRVGIAALLLTGVLTIHAAQSNGVALPFQTSPLGIVVAICTTAFLLSAVARGRHRQPPEHRERLRLLYAPTNSVEFAWTIVLGTGAGFSEEIAYRAVLYELLGRITGNYAVSIILCVVLFVLAHLPQGLRGAIGVGMMAIIFHIVYAVTGSLFAPVLIHAVYDIGLFTMMFRDERKLALTSIPEQEAVHA